MRNSRIIPCLLWRGRGLYKSRRFANHVYVGDPVNVVRIFNEKAVDELILLDIEATKKNYAPREAEIEEIVSEAFVPICYGGGIRRAEEVTTLMRIGIEKVALNTSALFDPMIIRKVADLVGSSSTIVSIDVKKPILGGVPRLWSHAGARLPKIDPVVAAVRAQEMGAGEILLQSVDRDGTMCGYDLELIRRVTSAIDIPVVACGGAGSVADLASAIQIGGASAAAAGSMFVFQGPHRAVLITFPDEQVLRTALNIGSASSP